MKNLMLLTSLCLLAGATSAIAAHTLAVDVKGAKVEWKGEKNIGDSHTGTVALKSGSLSSDGKMITGGEFVIDMNSLKNSDISDSANNAKLVGHLKSDDFFGVKEHPEAKFVAKKITASGGDKYNVEGDLTIKGATHPITFPATITSDGGTHKVVADIVVDRTKYDVRYGSKTFLPDLAANKIIKNDFTVSLALVAKAETHGKPAKKGK